MHVAVPSSQEQPASEQLKEPEQAELTLRKYLASAYETPEAAFEAIANGSAIGKRELKRLLRRAKIRVTSEHKKKINQDDAPAAPKLGGAVRLMKTPTWPLKNQWAVKNNRSDCKKQWIGL